MNNNNANSNCVPRPFCQKKARMSTFRKTVQSGKRVGLPSERIKMKLNELLKNDDCLYKAFLKSKKNRSYKTSALHFENNLFTNLGKLRKELLDRTYKVSKYAKFKVYEPKERVVLACSFRDKIVQHLICDNIIVPKFEKACILDNYSGQKGKGTGVARKRAIEIMSNFYKENGDSGWIVKADVKKFYYNISHEKAKEIMHKHLKGNEDIHWLVDLFIDSTDYIKNESYKEGTGLALGNQINTIISNLYLAELDRFIKETTRIKHYARYADDLYALVKTKEEAWDTLRKIERFLHEELKLQTNGKSQVMPIKNGIRFIGFHFYATNGKVTVKLDNSKKRAYRRKFNRIYKKVYAGRLEIGILLRSYSSWKEHAIHVTDHRIFFYYENKIKELIFRMTIENGYYIAECMSDTLPVSRIETDTFYLPVNIQKNEKEGKYTYEEYRFNLPINYKFPSEILEYMARSLDEYRLSLEEVGVV